MLGRCITGRQDVFTHSVGIPLKVSDPPRFTYSIISRIFGRGKNRDKRVISTFHRNDVFAVDDLLNLPSSMVLDVINELIVGLVASCNGALVDIVIMLAGGGLVAGGGRVMIVGGLVTVDCVT